ncbi:MAG: MFS transporter [Nocardiopsaceae bacterium]|nr:MFS transporter [Nocardiopsaceae bacterium]
MGRRRLGRRFGWLWGAYAVSAYGTGLGFGAFSIIAIRVLHAGPGQVAAISAVGTAAGAMVAVPLGPWVEFRRKRPVMIAMDLARFAAMATIPVAYGFGWLSLPQLIVVSVVVAAAKIAFRSASGAYLKQIVSTDDLLIANGRMESTTWSSIVLGPPLGGVAIGVLGPTATTAADAASYLLSALGITAIGGHESRPVRPAPDGGGIRPRMGTRSQAGVRSRVADIADGWRCLIHGPSLPRNNPERTALRPMFVNQILVGGLIMATEPLISVLMLGRFGFAPWQYTLALAAPCVGGFAGSRLASRLAARFGRRPIMLVSGTLRACFPLGMALMRPGVAGLVIVFVVQLGVVTSMGVYNPLMATSRLELAPSDVVARVLSAWTVSQNLLIAVLTGLWGVLASLTSPLTGIVAAGVLLLGTPFLLLRVPDVPRAL